MRTAGCRASPAGTASRPIIILPSTSYSISVAVVIADGVSRTLPATPVVRWGEDPRQCPQVEPLPGPLPFTRAVTGGGVHGTCAYPDSERETPVEPARAPRRPP